MNFNQGKKSNLVKKDIRVWKQKSILVSNNILDTMYKSQKTMKNHK